MIYNDTYASPSPHIEGLRDILAVKRMPLKLPTIWEQSWQLKGHGTVQGEFKYRKNIGPNLPKMTKNAKIECYQSHTKLYIKLIRKTKRILICEIIKKAKLINGQNFFLRKVAKNDQFLVTPVVCLFGGFPDNRLFNHFQP